MGRADSAVGQDQGRSPVVSDSSDNDIAKSPSSLYVKHSEKKPKELGQYGLPKHKESSPTTPRMGSVSSTARSNPHSGGSRSSSMHSRKPRLDERRPQARRMRTSPAGSLPRSNVESAISFHERSCRIMASLAPYPINCNSGDAPTHQVTSPPHLITPPFAHPLSRAMEPTMDHDSKSINASTKDVEVQSPACSVMHWTSEETRRKEYAKIDKQNSGFRKFVRSLLPSCLQKPSRMDFYDEKDGSDTCSVRRYRLDLSDDDR